MAKRLALKESGDKLPIVANPTIDVKGPTETELKAELGRAYESGDWKAMAAVAKKIDTAEKAKEKALLDAKRAVLDAVKDKLGAAIHKVVLGFWEDGELDAAEMVAYTWDLEEIQPVIRLVKIAPRAGKTGSGRGRKFATTTEEMLERHGSEEYKDGVSYQTAFESSTDGNWRYALRLKLLKLEGII